MSADIAFTKENLDVCLSRLAKEFRKLNGTKVPAEIILIGGAAVLANYGFRDMTYDIDAVIRASSSIKDAINKVGDEMGLPNGWLNSDFTRTKSYSPELLQYSEFYKKFGYVLEVRTVSGEYLVAMKLMSGRQYKNDISDVIGILREEKARGKPLTLEMIKTAVCNLYGSWDNLPQDSRDFITEVMRGGQLEILYEQYRSNEKAAKESLVNFEKKYPGVTNMDNINDIIKSLKRRKEEENQ
ncbi:MAG: hypothetical protein E7573_08760 [Ruminococcaceae bacterium]|nr:hypothetical protein [Oscillospiraceae bacterium]